MIIFIFLRTVISVYMANNVITPIYEAKVKILIEKPEETKDPFAEELNVAIEGEGSNDIKTQGEIIKSNPIIEEVVKRLKLEEREIPLTFTELCLDFIKSLLPTKSSTQKEDEKKDVFRKVVNNLKNNLKIESIKSTNIITISVIDSDDKMAAKIANTIVQVYIDQSLEIKSTEARNTYNFVTEQLKIMDSKLKSCEEAIKNFKEREGIISLSAEVETKVTNLSKFEADYYELQAQKKELQESYENFKKQLKLQDEKIISATTISENSIVKSLKADLTSLEISLPTLLEKYGKNHPKIMEVKSKINEVTSRLKDEVEKVINQEMLTLNPIHENIKEKLIIYESEINAFDAKGKALLTIIDRLKSGVENLAAKELILARLTRDLSFTEEIYNILLQKQQESLIEEAIKIANIRIVEPALVPKKPITPNKDMNLFIGILVSLMFGITFAFILEYLNHSFKTEKDIEEYLKLPVLGLIPKKKIRS